MKKIAVIVLPILLLAGCRNGGGFPDQSERFDWPIFRNEASLNGYTDIRLPKTPILLWTYKSNTSTVSSPVVKGGTTYWFDKTGVMRGVNLQGQLTFEYELHTPVEATPMIYDSTIYIGRMDGYMTALSLSKKDVVWNYKTDARITASPNITKFKGKKALIFGSFDKFLYCLDIKTGEKLCKFKSGNHLNSAVAIWKGNIIYGGYDPWIRIIDSEAGTKTDSLLVDTPIPVSPAVMGDYCYAGDYYGNIYKLMLENGKIIRNKKIIKANSDEKTFAAVPAISADAFYYLPGDKYIKAVSRRNGKQIWEYMLKGNTGESSPVIAKDKVIVCTKTGIISILDTETGILEWEYDTEEQIISSPAVIDKHFFILTATGNLLCFGNRK